MSHHKSRVTPGRQTLGYFIDFQAQERADLVYGDQAAMLQRTAIRPPERRPEAPIPAPPTPPSR